MNRVIGYIVVGIAVLMLLGINSSGFMQMFGLFFLLFAAMYLMIKHRLPKDFLTNFILLLFGPFILTTIVYSLLRTANVSEVTVNWFLLLLIILLAAIGWYGWYVHQHRGRRSANTSNLRSHEREFIIPFEHNPHDTDIQNEREDW